MSVLLFGVSHRSAPVSVLEQLSIDESDQAKIVDQVLQSPLVTEAMVLSTCNRVEVYAVVEAFHGGLSVIGQVLSDHCGMSMSALTKYAYVRYAEAAVEHLFAVTAGLDSLVIGEQHPNRPGHEVGTHNSTRKPVPVGPASRLPPSSSARSRMPERP